MQCRLHSRCFYPVLTAVLSLANVASADVYFVDDTAAGANDGSSWTDAFIDLHSALALAVSGDIVLVGQGTYRPAGPSGNRSISFVLQSGIVLRGSHAGAGAPDPYLRDPIQFPSILSGDLNSDDSGDHGDPSRAENSFHVVKSTSASPETVIDGFTITGGNADGPAATLADSGGGIQLIGASPLIINCTFDSNYAYYRGGAVALHSNSDATIRQCHFSGNRAGLTNGTGRGGGIWCGTHSNVAVEQCVFVGNRARTRGGAFNLFDTPPGSAAFIDCTFIGNSVDLYYGGAVFSQSGFVSVTRCRFEHNEAADAGGAVMVFGNVELVESVFLNNVAQSGGAVAISTDFEGVVVERCVFAGNHAQSVGGAMALNTNDATSEAHPLIINCVFTGNTANQSAGAMRIQGSKALVIAEIVNCTFSQNDAPMGGALRLGTYSHNKTWLHNCVLWGNTSNGATDQAAQLAGVGSILANHSTVQGWTGSIGGAGNNGFDPMFVDADGDDDVPGTEDDKLWLTFGSPCIDSANNANVPSFIIPLDVAGNPRFIDDPQVPDTGLGTPPIVDRGAYEHIPVCTGDITGDGLVNVLDLMSLLAAWGRCAPRCAADLTGDGMVNVVDLLVLIQAWGPCS